MSRFNFCGPTYQALSPSFAAQFTMNWYLVPDESGDARSRMALYPTPGVSLVNTLPGCSGVVGMFEYLGRLFAVGQVIPTASLAANFPSFSGNYMNIWEVLPNGNLFQCAGNFSFPGGGVVGVNVPGAPMVGVGQGLVSILGAPGVSSGNANPTLIVVTGGTIYYFGLAYGILAAPAELTATAIVNNDLYSGGEFVKSFLVSMITGGTDDTTGEQFQIFGPGPSNLSFYQGLNIATITEFPDYLVGMIASDDLIYFFGEKRCVPYYNSGALFPFVPVPGVLIEKGLAGANAKCRADNTIFWLDNDERGGRMAYRMNGYTGQRISTFPIEEAWASYATVSDCIVWSYQDSGHIYVVFQFPTANATWVYDVATQMWHQRGYWKNGQFNAQLQQCHAYCYGKHFVGDATSGNIYVQSIANLADNGNTVRRVRRAPYIAKEHENVFHKKLEVLAEMGLPTAIAGPSPNPTFLNIADANGVLWAVTISDAGAITVAHAAAGQVATPGQVVLADNVNQSTFWQLGVSIGGALSGTQTQFGKATLAIYAMATLYGFKDSGLQVNQAGVVSAIAPTAHLVAPQILLRWSDDGGKNWSNYYAVSLGLTGQTLQRAIWRRLGKSRNRVYEISCSDPYPLRIIDAFLNDPSDAQERLNDKLRSMA